MSNNAFPEEITVNTGLNELNRDAWGRGKVIIDHSIFHGMFTFEVPDSMWIEEVDKVEQLANINFTSVSGALLCTGINGQVNALFSKRNPRYQPNRGYLYSSSMMIDTAANPVDHLFGAATETSGLFFKVNANVLYAVVRTTRAGITFDDERIIDWDGDLTKGNVFDIQAQWRGVGNIKFFINLELVYTYNNLGTLNELSINNPAMPIAFSINGEGSMRCGCVDITSEGGAKDTRQFGFTGTDEISLSNVETPVIVLQMERFINYEGLDVRNTQDIALRRLSAFADDNTIFKVYYTRNANKFIGTTFNSVDSGGVGQLVAINGDIVIDNLLGMTLFEITRVPANGSVDVENPDELYGDLYLTAGDFIVVTLKAKNATLGGASLDWGTEI